MFYRLKDVSSDVRNGRLGNAKMILAIWVKDALSINEPSRQELAFDGWVKDAFA